MTALVLGRRLVTSGGALRDMALVELA